MAFADYFLIEVRKIWLHHKVHFTHPGVI